MISPRKETVAWYCFLVKDSYYRFCGISKIFQSLIDFLRAFRKVASYRYMAYRQTYCFVEFIHESVALLSVFSLVRFPVELYREKRLRRGAIAYEKIDMARLDPSARAVPADSMSGFDEVLDANFREDNISVAKSFLQVDEKRLLRFVHDSIFFAIERKINRPTVSAKKWLDGDNYQKKNEQQDNPEHSFLY